MSELPPKKPAIDIPQVPNSECIREALEKQAALRPPKTPPKLMPITPTLPRIPKPRNRRRRKA